MSDDYINENLRKNRSKEKMDKFGDAPIDYTNVIPVSNADLSIENSKPTEELEEFARLDATADIRIDESKDKSRVYLIQKWAKKVRCKKVSGL